MASFRPVDPKQSFPDLEERVLERWRERDVFARSLSNRESAPLWGFYEGPPTANGRPGSHHVLARVFKDIYPRFRTMTGRLVPRKAGWDCHGLPVELEVERELGITSKEEIEDYGIAEFNDRCRESVFRYVEEWNRLTERIGFWLDLDDPYVTMTNEYIESVWWALRRIWDDGRLYEDYKVVPYCPRDGTALSSHEVALGYKDVEDPAVYVKLPIKHPVPNDAIPESPFEPGDQLLVWTTTPWTLITNAAVAAGPDIEYVRAGVGGGVFILAKERVEHVLGEEAEILAHFPGEAIAGTSYEPPFDYITDYGPRGHTVLLADFVTTDEGTGLVHTAIAFGEDDFRLGEQYEIKLQNPVNLSGRFDERITDFQGQFVKDADPAIVEALEKKGKLLRAEAYLHAYPHCWRCDTPLLYYAKSSWYVKTTEVRDRLLAANEEIGWHPEHIKHGRFGKWLEGNVDWALSRQRYWGTPLPVWRCEKGHAFCAGSVSDLSERGGEVPDDLHRPFIDEVVLRCEECGGEMRRVPDLIDVWWDSGCMPFAQWHAPFKNQDVFEQRFPADYICEALDQTRGWFYSLLAVSTLLFDRAPYRTVLCLGHIADPEGKKMSKSLGNIVVPWDVIDRHGADAFRWYYLTSKQPWDGYLFSVETVGESLRQFLLQLWNTYGFYVLYANVNDVAEHAGPATDLDHWALSRLQATVEEVRDRLDHYDATRAGHAIAAFVDDLSNWYVRRSRRRFWDGDPAAFGTLGTCLATVAQLLAPFCPFLADEIYDNLDGAEPSVHLCDFPEAGERDHALEYAMGIARETVALGLRARGQSKLKVRQPLRAAVVVAGPPGREALDRLADVVREELNVKELRYVEQADELGAYEVKPNYRALGPRFGKAMPQVAAAVAALEPAHVAATLRNGGHVGISIEGTEHELASGDLLIAMMPLEGYQLEREGSHAVALELDLDADLRREGLAREVVHAVQNARKSAGLEVEDLIGLRLGGDDELLAAARAFLPYLAGETLARSVDSADGAEG